jgi:hypothetical protein
MLLPEPLYLSNNKMNNLESKVNLILSEWNPIVVDRDIAQTEYVTYIPRIIESLKDKQSLMLCLQDILDKMGVNYDSNDRQHVEDLKSICSKLLTLER